MSLFAPLFAAVDPGLVKLILAVIVFIMIGIGKLLGATQGARDEARRAAKRTPQPQEPAPAASAGADDEVDEFLRKAQQRKLRRQTSTREGQPARPLRRAVAKPLVAEAVEETSKPQLKPVGDQLTQHVEKYLSADEFDRHTSQLGGEVVEAERELDQHFHQVFDHRVSELETVPGEAAVPPAAVEPSDLSAEVAPEAAPDFVLGVLDLLSSPESLGQAVILNEILHRPEERWV
jgi:hypothetical protein